MYVPAELLLEILRHLEKIDLKTVRLVSHSFSQCASGFLFDTVYVSAHKVDFDVLCNIADHPQLSRCVKKLKYDASQFPTMSKQRYMYELGLQLLEMMDSTGKTPQDNPDPDVNGFVETLNHVATDGLMKRISKKLGEGIAIQALFKADTESFCSMPTGSKR